jgi:iron complex transport system permease protein
VSATDALAGEEVRHPVNWRRRVYALVGLTVLLVAMVVVGVSVGSTYIPVDTTWQILLSKLPWVDIYAGDSGTDMIITNIRLPRVLLAGIAGAALAVAGAAYQGLFRNPLADPFLMGVASGAGLGAVIAMTFTAGWFAWLVVGVIPFFAFLGALLAVGLVYLISRVGNTLPVTIMILAGVIVAAFFAAISHYLMLTVEGLAHQGLSFLWGGGLSTAEWPEVKVAFVIMVVGAAIICLCGRHLNVMQLDEEQAQQLGVDVERVKRVLIVAATIVTAGAVAFAGVIGFVGIIVPHFVRLVWGPDYRFLTPLSMLVGAIFLILVDALMRVSPGPEDAPIGIFTALVGGPFFLYLLRRKKAEIFF